MDNEHYHDLIQVMVSAGATDETAATTLRRSDRLYWKTLEKTALRLADLKALKPGLTVRRATDILWFYFGHRSWHLLNERKWSWSDAEQWLAEQVSQALLAHLPGKSGH
jgi:hypothetical protein